MDPETTAGQSRWPRDVNHNELVNGGSLYCYDQDGEPIALRSSQDLLDWLNSHRETATALEIASDAGGAARSIVDACNLERAKAVLRHGYSWLSHFTGETVARPPSPTDIDEASRLIDELVAAVEAEADCGTVSVDTSEGEVDREALIEGLKPAIRNAWRAFEFAVHELGDETNDDQVYGWRRTLRP